MISGEWAVISGQWTVGSDQWGVDRRWGGLGTVLANRWETFGRCAFPADSYQGTFMTGMSLEMLRQTTGR